MRGLFAILAAALLAFIPVPAAAHGGLSMDEDTCRLKIGMYFMHFTGYQPELTGAREFCEDIPKTGHIVVTMDMIDEALRTMPISVRIIRDTGDESQLDRLTVMYVAPRLYPNGSVSFEHMFAEPGKFVGLVAAGENGENTSRFPFSVGYSPLPYGLIMLVLFIVAAGFGFYHYSARNREAGQ